MRGEGVTSDLKLGGGGAEETLLLGCILLELFSLFLFRFRNNTQFQFRKERSLCFRSGNGIGGDLRTTISAPA